MEIKDLVDMSDEDFERWLEREKEHEKTRFRQCLYDAVETFKCEPLRQEDLADLKKALDQPYTYKPVPVFVTEEEIRALRRKSREKKSVEPLPPNQ